MGIRARGEGTDEPERLQLHEATHLNLDPSACRRKTHHLFLLAWLLRLGGGVVQGASNLDRFPDSLNVDAPPRYIWEVHLLRRWNGLAQK